MRKIGAPGHPELGLGAVVDGAHPQLVINEDVVAELGVPASYLEAEAERELQEIERRRRCYVGDRHPIAVEGRTVVVVDDGIATVGTVRRPFGGSPAPAQLIWFWRCLLLRPTPSSSSGPKPTRLCA